MKEIRELFKKIVILHGVSDRGIGFLIDNSSEEFHQPGEFVFREGERTSKLYFIMDGKAEVLKNRGPDHVHIFDLSTGSCFGEMELIDLGPRSASIRAVSCLKVRSIDKNGLFNMYKEHDRDYFLMMMNIAREISRRLRAVDDLLISYEMAIEKAGHRIIKERSGGGIVLE